MRSGQRMSIGAHLFFFVLTVALVATLLVAFEAPVGQWIETFLNGPYYYAGG